MLSQTKLRDLILDLTDPDSLNFNPDDPSSAWTDVYDSYAVDAQDASDDAVVSTNAAGFHSQLSLAHGLTPAQAAAEFDAAFVAYWTGATFGISIPAVAPVCPSSGGNGIFGLEISSVVTVVTPGVLGAALLALFNVVTPDFTTRATQLAAAFHAATTGAITVLITGTDTTPSPAGPLPITNLCGVF